MLKRRVIVHVSDARISGNPHEIIATYSLGSCLGICLYDPAAHIGGMLHCQLPDSGMEPEKARDKPQMFVDTGMKWLMDGLIAAGAITARLQVKVAGGAAMDMGPKGFDIGKRNYLAVRKVLWKNGMFVNGQDVGGSSPRNMYLNIETGEVTVRSMALSRML